MREALLNSDNSIREPLKSGLSIKQHHEPEESVFDDHGFNIGLSKQPSSSRHLRFAGKHLCLNKFGQFSQLSQLSVGRQLELCLDGRQASISPLRFQKTSLGGSDG